MSEIDTKLAQLETESLETHVAVAHERFKNLDTSINRLEGLIEKNVLKQKKDYLNLKRLLSGQVLLYLQQCSWRC